MLEHKHGAVFADIGGGGGGGGGGGSTPVASVVIGGGGGGGGGGTDDMTGGKAVISWLTLSFGVGVVLFGSICWTALAPVFEIGVVVLFFKLDGPDAKN